MLQDVHFNVFFAFFRHLDETTRKRPICKCFTKKTNMQVFRMAMKGNPDIFCYLLQPRRKRALLERICLSSGSQTAQNIDPVLWQGLLMAALYHSQQKNRYHGHLLLVDAITSTRLASNVETPSPPTYGLKINHADSSVGRLKPNVATPLKVARANPLSHELEFARLDRVDRCFLLPC